MKRSNLLMGILYVLLGFVFLAAALTMETRLDGILWGLTGACTAPGVLMIIRYFYWNSPEKKAVYEARLENEEIEMHDELKTKVRDKAGRYAYTAGILVISLSMLIFSVLGSLEIIENARIIVLFLGAYLIFQIAVGIVIFNRLMKKY